jgi:hypothetical protein
VNRTPTFLLVILTAVMPLSGSIMLSVSPVSGTIETNVTPDNVEYVSWSQTIEYGDVSIEPYLSSSSDSDVEYSAFLTTSLGPGTTLADEVASQNFVMPADSPAAYVTLFAGLDLTPGNYYLVLAGDLSGAALAWEAAAPNPLPPPPIIPTSVIHLAPGVSLGTDGVSTSPSIAEYVPASDFSGQPPDPLLFQITSDTPEPSTWMLVAIGFLGLFVRTGSNET